MPAATTTFLEPGTDATQDLSFFRTVTGTVASDATVSYTGPRSLKCSVGNPAANTTVLASAGVIADSGSQVSIYVRFDSLPSATSVIYTLLTTALSVAQVQINTSGNLIMAPTGATAVTGSSVLAINTWYRISVSYYITNTTTFQFRLYINGIPEATASAGTLTRTGTDTIRIGTTSGYGADKNLWYDNIYAAKGGASSSSQPDTGNILMTAKRPNANGTANNFSTQIGSGGSGYGLGKSPQVNEQPLSTTNGWSIINAGSVVTEEYNIEDMRTGDVNIRARTIVSCMGWVYASALAAETGKIIWNGDKSNISITTTNTMFMKYSNSRIDAAHEGEDIGIETDATVTTVSLYECGVVCAFTRTRTML